MSPPRSSSTDSADAVYVVGAGLTGATAAWALHRAGRKVVVIEREKVVGGHTRSEWLHGIPYEPNGAHIFHTDDSEVWKLASGLTEFVPYEHRVRTRIGSQTLSWPMQLEELAGLAEWPQIQRELAALPSMPDSSNFQTWCLGIMGETLFHLFVAGYTAKQWGRDPSELSTEFAPKRVELRSDGYLGLFRDPHQGWPKLGYSALSEALLEHVDIQLCEPITSANVGEVIPPGATVVMTGPLDDFYDDVDGALEWRGVRLVPHWIPDEVLALEAMVVNEPDVTIPYTRSVETKHVLTDLHDRPGTVVCFEYPGSQAKHYPVYDAAGANRGIQQRYEDRLRAETRYRLIPAGRLAKYLYINMDESMRQGLNVAEEVLRSRP